MSWAKDRQELCYILDEHGVDDVLAVIARYCGTHRQYRHLAHPLLELMAHAKPGANSPVDGNVPRQKAKRKG